ncbi:hypothetical protein GCM10023116_13290 [Kistimonas scapharcae]|uniref:Uncharacterized protein n=1 Tax=Kistimonas scapharcae TaxID=1036133 RepID=A0ABP8V1V8_9GAMM
MVTVRVPTMDGDTLHTEPGYNNRRGVTEQIPGINTTRHCPCESCHLRKECKAECVTFKHWLTKSP